MSAPQRELLRIVPPPGHTPRAPSERCHGNHTQTSCISASADFCGLAFMFYVIEMVAVQVQRWNRTGRSCWSVTPSTTPQALALRARTASLMLLICALVSTRIGFLMVFCFSAAASRSPGPQGPTTDDTNVFLANTTPRRDDRRCYEIRLSFQNRTSTVPAERST